MQKDQLLIKEKKIGIIGYGSQGRAQVLNLKDSGLSVVCSLPSQSKTALKAKEDKISVLDNKDLVIESDIIVLLTPDETQGKIYKNDILPNITKDKLLIFAHGYAVVYKEILLKDNIDVALLAFKAPGPVLRDNFLKGINTPSFYSIKRDVSGNCSKLIEEYSTLCGSKYPLRFETTFEEETTANLFSEQTLACAGITGIMKTSFDVLVSNGVSPDIAYFECIHKMKNMIEMIHGKGFSEMYKNISNVAEFGDYYARDKLFQGSLHKSMQEIYNNIKNGEFHKAWQKEQEEDFPLMNKTRKEDSRHLSEKMFDKYGE